MVPSYWNCSEFFSALLFGIVADRILSLFFVLTKLIIPHRFSFLSFFLFLHVSLFKSDIHVSMFIASCTFIFDGREEVTLLKTVKSYRRKKTVKKKQEERKKGPLIFFSPFILFVSFMCSVFLVFLFQQKMRTKYSGIGLLCASFCSPPPHPFYFVSFFFRTPPPVRFIASRPDLED